MADGLDNYTSIAEWLRDRTKRFHSYREASDKVGIDRGVLAKYIDGAKVPPDELVRRLARFFRDDEAAALDLAARTRATSDPDTSLADRIADRILSTLDARIGAEYVPGAASDGEAIARPGGIEITVSGTCMQPELEPGDRVIVDRSRAESWTVGDPVAFWHNGQRLVKRVRRIDGELVLAGNDGTIVRPDEVTRVVGVVTGKVVPLGRA